MRIRVTTRKVVVTAVVVTVFVVLIGFMLVYTSSDGFCRLCHDMQPSVDAMERSAHADVNCEQCHTKPGPFFFLTAKMEALQEPVKQISGNYEKPILGVVLNSSCRRCHTDEQLFPTISRNGINVNHKHLIEAGYQCVSCHSTTAHLDAVPEGARTYPTMDQCLVCHNNDYTAPDGTVALSTCDICHVKPATGTEPSNHVADWRQIHGSAGILSTCSACHPPIKGAAPPPGGWTSKLDCTKCHRGVLMPHPEAWLSEHGAASLEKGEESCALCHDTKTYCMDCHGVRMPHPQKWLGMHRQVVRARNAAVCLNCHQFTSCDACHTAHRTGSPPAHHFLTGKPAGGGQ